MDSWKEKFLKIPKQRWFLFLLLGILLLVIAIPVPKTEKNSVSLTGDGERVSAGTVQDTVTDMERRLENILRSMEGAGEVKVMITQKTSGEKIVEKDSPVSDRSTSESDSSGTTRNTLEQDKEEATVYERDENGSQIPYVTMENAPQIMGVLVLAQGGDNGVVVKNITDAVMALFGLEAHKIKVMKMN